MLYHNSVSRPPPSILLLSFLPSPHPDLDHDYGSWTYSEEIDSFIFIDIRCSKHLCGSRDAEADSMEAPARTGARGRIIIIIIIIIIISIIMIMIMIMIIVVVVVVVVI